VRTATAVLAAVGLVGVGLSVPLVAPAAPTSVSVPSISSSKLDAAKYPAGNYIVTLRDAPAATYTGGLTGYPRTMVSGGKQLNAKSSTVTKYTGYLNSKQSALAKLVGATPLYKYAVAYNGFAAKLTSVQAARLARSSSVLSVVPSEMLKVQDSHSLEYLGVTGDGGTWDQIGGEQNAGEGIVVGDIDTGIAPENPSFAGDPLGTDATTGEPYLDGNTIKFVKSDGNTFASTRTNTHDEWSDADYSTKIIGAQTFLAGFGIAATGDSSVGEYYSPRDGAGHGSHTASTAAGDYGVEATVSGQDFGTISGVAPAAKLAIYKACWSGPDPTTEDDDGCDTIDLLGAINQAVLDGVDVINFSIGGGSATTTFSPTDAAFLNATAAGIFVAAAAGNAGPDASTLDNAAPWETTVAASTIPDYEGTIELGNGDKYVGAGITVTENVGPAPVVLASDHPADGVDAADANLCGPDTLGDVTGDIVVCDRGVYDRVAKSAEVEAAGGIGMILVNQPDGADDVDNDFHSVPTVHTYAANHDAIHAYAATTGATATLEPGNTTPDETPVPQIAGFSSHGPVLAAGSDVLKPDISAPGVSILAAVANSDPDYEAPEGYPSDPQYDFYSGTSMATPHIAGLAALYLGEHPLASPAEIKSALMTTATDLVDSTGADVTDPFIEGAGEVHPTTYLNPGLYYGAGLADWKSYIVGADQVADYSRYVPKIDFEGVEPIDGSDLNQASIAIGDLVGEQTVTRTVTALTAGTYTASIDVPGVTAEVDTPTLTLDAGESATFHVTFSNDSAALDAWATGFLTWTSGDTTVRSPVAVHPTTARAPASVAGEGTTGSTDVAFTSGVTGELPLTFAGFTKGDKSLNEEDPSADYTDVADEAGNAAFYEHDVAAGATSVEFDLYPLTDSNLTDLDLYVYYQDDEGAVTLVGQSTSTGAVESVVVDDPEPGVYFTDVEYFAVPSGGAPYVDVAYVTNPAKFEGAATLDPASLETTAGEDASYTIDWKGLAPFSLYRGAVAYGDSSVRTVLDVTTAETAITNVSKPAFTTTVEPGHTARVSTGTWSVPTNQLTFTYRWTADGKGISGVTGSSYLIPSSRAGQVIGVQVTAHQLQDHSDPVTVTGKTAKWASTTTITIADGTLTTSQHGKVTVKIASAGSGDETGTVILHYGSRSSTVTVTAANKGTVAFTLPLLAKGSYPTYAEWRGNGKVASSVSTTRTIKVS
jgi:subtilisin family serine protease